MDTSTLLLLILTATLAGISLYAWYIGNERRDVALLGTFSALCGGGALITATL